MYMLHNFFYCPTHLKDFCTTLGLWHPTLASEEMSILAIERSSTLVENLPSRIFHLCTILVSAVWKYQHGSKMESKMECLEMSNIIQTFSCEWNSAFQHTKTESHVGMPQLPEYCGSALVPSQHFESHEHSPSQLHERYSSSPSSLNW